MRKIFHTEFDRRFLSITLSGTQVPSHHRFARVFRRRSQAGAARILGPALALLTAGGKQRMSSRASKIFMLLLSLASLTSAFIERHSANAPPSLLLFGTGMLSMAAFSRRHFAGEN